MCVQVQKELKIGSLGHAAFTEKTKRIAENGIYHIWRTGESSDVRFVCVFVVMCENAVNQRASITHVALWALGALRE